MEDLAAQALGQPEHVDGAMHAGLGRLNRVVLVMHGRGRTGEIVDFVDLDIERKGHVVAHELEPWVAVQVVDVALRAGEQVVEADHLVPLIQQAVDQVRPDEPGTAGDEDAFPAVVKACHCRFPLRRNQGTCCKRGGASQSAIYPLPPVWGASAARRAVL